MSEHRRNRRTGWRPGWWGVLAAVCLAGWCVSAAGPGAELEYQVKAGYLFNFAKFVEWPAETNAAPTAFRIGIVDDGTVFPVMAATLAGKQVQGRTLELRRLKPGDPAGGCHLVFIARSQSERADELLNEVGTAPILTVGETDGFAERGGCINFVLRQQNIRFEVNLAAAERAQLKISSKIASMATLVRPRKEAK